MKSQKAAIESQKAAVAALQSRVDSAEELAQRALRVAEAAEAAANAAKTTAEAAGKASPAPAAPAEQGEPGALTASEQVTALEGRIDELGNETKALRERLESPKGETRAAPGGHGGQNAGRTGGDRRRRLCASTRVGGGPALCARDEGADAARRRSRRVGGPRAIGGKGRADRGAIEGGLRAGRQAHSRA